MDRIQESQACVRADFQIASRVAILNRYCHHPLDRALRSAQHCPTQSLLQHLSHAVLQRQSEKYLVIAFLVISSSTE